MAGEWPTKTIDELKAKSRASIAIGPFGSRMKSDCYVPVGVPVIRGTNISDTRDLVGEMVYITPEKAEEVQSSIIVADDLFFPHRGSIGLVGIVPRNGAPRYVQSSSMMKLTCDRSQVEPLYLFYFFRSAQGRQELLKNASTVGTPGIGQPLSSLKAIHVPYPPLAEQKAIAAVLGALDDKIELNRRMNATLEAMARALFQSWFVDFDPVRAKLDGRPPAPRDPPTPALFPEHLEETALGHTPKGWEVRSLDKTAHYLNGLALQKYPPGDGPTLPVIKIAQLRKGDSVGADRCNTDLRPEYIVQDGDVLFSWSGSLEVELWCGGPGALNQHLFKVTSPEFPKWFYYLWTLYHLDEFRLIAADKATTMGHIQRGHLTAAKVLIPPRPLLDAMTRTMSPLIDQLIANRIQSRTLATLRDTLLPKLLSGELSVAKSFPEVYQADTQAV
jgi:type I restriction enzyme S subunit